MGSPFEFVADWGVARESMLLTIKGLHDDMAARAIWDGEILRPRTWLWRDEDGNLHFKLYAKVIEVVAPWRQPC